MWEGGQERGGAPADPGPPGGGQMRAFFALIQSFVFVESGDISSKNFNNCVVSGLLAGS